jgi:hypothetical protein
MRKTLAVLAIAAAIAVLAAPPIRAQLDDAGIRVITNALKATLTFTPVPAATNGWSPFLANGLSTTVTTVKSSAGELGAYHCLNPNASAAYIQVFDTSGAVMLGTTTPVLSLGLPASDGGNLEWGMGVHFANAIKVAATTTATGSTAPGTAIDCDFAFK